jgi:hypothetical protein
MTTKLILSLVLATVISFSLTGCGGTSTTAPAPSGVTTPALISQTDLSVIQTGASIATGAYLSFGVKDPTARTQLANQIYGTAEGVYKASGGKPLTSTEFSALLASYDAKVSPEYEAGYATLVSSLGGLYSAWYQKLANTSNVTQNLSGLLGAIANGVESGASVYATTPAPATK